jgi:hypothetical protein
VLIAVLSASGSIGGVITPRMTSAMRRHWTADCRISGPSCNMFLEGNS